METPTHIDALIVHHKCTDAKSSVVAPQIYAFADGALTQGFDVSARRKVFNRRR